MADDVAVAGVIIAALGAVFQGLLVLHLISPSLSLGIKEPATCPNCGQVFDVSQFPIVNGQRRVTCPRCRYTW